MSRWLCSVMHSQKWDKAEQTQSINKRWLLSGGWTCMQTRTFFHFSCENQMKIKWIFWTDKQITIFLPISRRYYLAVIVPRNSCCVADVSTTIREYMKNHKKWNFHERVHKRRYSVCNVRKRNEFVYLKKCTESSKINRNW